MSEFDRNARLPRAMLRALGPFVPAVAVCFAAAPSLGSVADNVLAAARAGRLIFSATRRQVVRSVSVPRAWSSHSLVQAAELLLSLPKRVPIDLCSPVHVDPMLAPMVGYRRVGI